MSLKGIILITVSIILVGGVLAPLCMQDSQDVVEILIIDGQSNAEYGDSYVCSAESLNEEYTLTPNHNLYYYGSKTAPANNWQWSMDYQKSWAPYNLRPMYSDKWLIGGYEPILANTLAEKSGHDVIVVNMAIGSRTIEMLLPDGSDADYCWTLLDRALARAHELYDKVVMAGVVWAQGEGDKDAPVEEYVENFHKLMDGFEKYGAGEYYIIHTRDYYGGNANIAQEQLAAENSNVQIASYISESFAPGSEYIASNLDIHYSQKGRTAIAMELKDAITPPEIPSEGYENLIKIIPILVIIAIIGAVAAIALNRER